MYTTRKHGRLADWAITELVALLDSLFFSVAESQFLRNVFYSHCTWTTHLDSFTAVPCCVPQGPGVEYSMRVIISRLLQDSTSFYYEFILPSDATLDVLLIAQ